MRDLLCAACFCSTGNTQEWEPLDRNPAALIRLPPKEWWPPDRNLAATIPLPALSPQAGKHRMAGRWESRVWPMHRSEGDHDRRCVREGWRGWRMRAAGFRLRDFTVCGGGRRQGGGGRVAEGDTQGGRRGGRGQGGGVVAVTALVHGRLGVLGFGSCP